jgi:hypothetical protein
MPIMNGLDAARPIGRRHPPVHHARLTGTLEVCAIDWNQAGASKSSGGIEQLMSTVKVLLDQKH